jgi:hypothetical protein
MELKTPKIPEEFIETLPEGMKFVHKHGREFLVVEEVFCSKGHSLIADSVQIHGEPSIKIDVTIEKQAGSFYIDAFWGSHAKLYSFMPVLKEKDTIIEAFCPVCGTSLITESACEQEACAAKQHIFFELPDKGNRILVCARLGCPGHRIEIRNIPVDVTEMVSEINYFGAQMDDVFKGI